MKPFQFETVYIPTPEYAKIVSEINTNFRKYSSKKTAVHMSYGIDGKPYWYFFEIRGYDDYNIYLVADRKVKMNKELMEIEVLLKDISDSYYDFVTGILNYAKKKPERREKLLNYLRNNPEATSSDVVLFVSTQPDFFEDSIYPKKSKESIA